MQIIRYGITQIGVYSVDFIVFIFFYEFIEIMYVYANTISKIVACLVAFFIHKFYTFKSNENILKEFIKYFSFLPINILIGTILLGLMLSIETDYRFAKIFSDIIAFFISFLLAKKFIFNSTKNQK
tara:strand:+ start:1733 stop:2110 length:378 start_codon:yes stop_codon:yes gene_type:complete